MNRPNAKPLLTAATFTRTQALIAALLLNLTGQIPGLCQAPGIPDDVVSNIVARVNNAMVPGIVVGMINSNGTTFFSYGVRDLHTVIR